MTATAPSATWSGERYRILHGELAALERRLLPFEKRTIDDFFASGVPGEFIEVQSAISRIVTETRGYYETREAYGPADRKQVDSLWSEVNGVGGRCLEIGLRAEAAMGKPGYPR